MGDATTGDLADDLADALDVLVVNPVFYKPVGGNQLQFIRRLLRTQRPYPGIELLGGHFVAQEAAAALPGDIHPNAS